MPLPTLSPPISAGRYYFQAALQNMFTVYCGAQATSLAGTALIGLQLWNPPGSGRNLVLVDSAGMIIVSSSTTTSIALAYGLAQTSAPTSTTAATTITSTLLGPATIGAAGVLATQVQKVPIGQAFAAGTFINTPSLFKNLLHNTAAINTVGEDPGWQIDFNGKWIVPPGSYVAIVAVGAAVASGGMNADLTWIEAPI
jgi:hypothetical protein